MEMNSGQEVISSIHQLCVQLVGCVNQLHDPNLPQQERIHLDQIIEDFKENNPNCLKCGFQMVAAQGQGSVVKHFGLQLIEHYVRFRWESLVPMEQDEFQMNLLEYMTNGILPDGQEACYIKECLARVVVETTKKCWPQKWNSFVADMLSLSKIGVSQFELVMIIFRRLVEDVHIYDNDLPPNRRKEMTAALNDNAHIIFEVLLLGLEAPPSIELRAIALSAISSCVEWMEFNVLLMADCKLLVLLYTLIGEEELKTLACECLLCIVAKKGDIKRTGDERMKLLALLSQDALAGFLKASESANCVERFTEVQYVFLKRMCQLIVQLGITQLCPLWLNQPGFNVPVTFDLYLQAVLEFTKHPSQMLSETTCELWNSFINHNYIKENEVFKLFLPTLLRVMRERFFKVGDPTHTEHCSSMYSRIDFDGLEEHTVFFSGYRSKVYKIVNQLAKVIPHVAAAEAFNVLQALVQKKELSGCSKSSMLYIEWDGYVSYLECWTNALKGEDLIENMVECGRSVLQLLLSFQTLDTLLLQCQFRCIQNAGLLSLVGNRESLLIMCVQKVFSSIGFMGGYTDKYKLPKDVVAVRNLVVTSFIRLCETYPTFLSKFLDDFYSQYCTLLKSDVLVYTEKCNFIDAIFLLSQTKHGVQEQSQFIEELLAEVKEVCHQLQNGVATIKDMIEYFCLNKDPADPSYLGRDRGRAMCFVVHTVSLLLRRAKPFHEISDSIASIQDHPTFHHIFPLLDSFFVPFLRSLYQLWSGESNQSLEAHFVIVSQLHQFEKDFILGRTAVPRSELTDFGEVGSIQMNFSTAHDGSLQSIAKALSVYGAKTFWKSGMMAAIQQLIISNFEFLNNWRLRSVLHIQLNYSLVNDHLIAAVVSTCPEEMWNLCLMPFLYEICCRILTRLKKCWELTMQRKVENVILNEDIELRCSTAEEMLEDQMTIHLSREYSTLLESMCTIRLGSNRRTKKPPGFEEECAMDGVDEMCEIPHKMSDNSKEQWSLYQELTSMGKWLLTRQDMCDVLLWSSFLGMAWNDSPTSSKCINVAGLIYTNLPLETIPEDFHVQLFEQVLVALQIHGVNEHVKNQLSFLALLIYQSTFKVCPTIQDTVCQLPGTTRYKVQSFNKLLEKQPPMSVKVKKERFKDLVSGLVGKHIAQSHRRSVMFDLPEMQYKCKAKDNQQEVLEDLSTLF